VQAQLISSRDSWRMISFTATILIVGGAALFLLNRGLAQRQIASDAQQAQTAIQPTAKMDNSDNAGLSRDQLRKKLTPIQYRVTCQNGTEPPFQNEYWNNHRAGIYVDVITGEPLFSSLDKFESGTGWPSFTKPLPGEHVVEKKDRTLWMTRTEVRSRKSDAHLGHVFDDGPQPTGLRYCMNSASLRFVPVEKLQEEGYGQYLPLFSKTETAKQTEN
jgi:methionine-R-sulfoxide reductase